MITLRDVALYDDTLRAVALYDDITGCSAMILRDVARYDRMEDDVGDTVMDPSQTCDDDIISSVIWL